MKCITFLVPCYNSEAYIDRCVNSLVVAGEDAEIIIVNDGSTDRTGEIAEQYALQYPDIVRVINQAYGGHGSAVNRGIENAEGVYFKVVDSDDWLDPTALQTLMVRLRVFCMMQLRSQITSVPDLLICNYVYDHLNESSSRSVGYRQAMHPDIMYGWDGLNSFRLSQYFVMHAMIYRTSVLKDCGIVLPEHIFYEDNLYSYQPLPFTKRLYYIDIDLYHYFIGRADQSVNENVMLKNVDQQVRIAHLMSRAADMDSVRLTNPKLASYMRRYLSMIYAITTVLLLMTGTEKAHRQYTDLWEGLKKHDPETYRLLRYHSMSILTTLPGWEGRRAIIAGYHLARRIYKFN
mgnify:CR=1 FL=1